MHPCIAQAITCETECNIMVIDVQAPHSARSVLLLVLVGLIRVVCIVTIRVVACAAPHGSVPASGSCIAGRIWACQEPQVSGDMQKQLRCLCGASAPGAQYRAGGKARRPVCRGLCPAQLRRNPKNFRAARQPVGGRARVAGCAGRAPAGLPNSSSSHLGYSSSACRIVSSAVSSAALRTSGPAAASNSPPPPPPLAATGARSPPPSRPPAPASTPRTPPRLAPGATAPAAGATAPAAPRRPGPSSSS